MHKAESYIDTRTKTVIAFIFIITVVSTPPVYIKSFICYGGLLSWYAAFNSIKVSRILKKAAMVLPFSFFAAVWQPFMHGGETFTLAGLNLSVIGSFIFANVMIKSFLGASCIVLLMSVNSFPELLHALRKMKVPAVIVDMLALTYRFIFVFATEAANLLRAARARGYKPKWLSQAKLVGMLIGKLFLNSFEKSERIYGAMLLRGYDGYMPTNRETVLKKNDFILFSAVILILFTVRFYVK